MLQLLANGCFARALRSTHPNKEGRVWVRLFMLLQLALKPKVDGEVVLVHTASAIAPASGREGIASLHLSPLKCFADEPIPLLFSAFVIRRKVQSLR